MNLEEGFLKDTLRRFENYRNLGEKTFEQLQETDFFFRPSPQSNSIAVIIQHLYGNMLSRFTNFLTEDGEKPWRKRDAEFEEMQMTAADLRSCWEEGWNCLFAALRSLGPGDLTKTIYIRTEPLFVYDAILRQLAHYASHVGQIITIGRIIRDKDWKTLSIEKGASKQYDLTMANKFLKK